MANLHIVEAEVISSITNGYRLKVSVLDLGMFTYGWTARHSERSKDGWWVQPPAVRYGKGWKPTIEFDKSKSLWLEIKSACIDAVQNYHAPEKVIEISDEELTDEAITEALDKTEVELNNKQQPKAISWLDEDD